MIPPPVGVWARGTVPGQSHRRIGFRQFAARALLALFSTSLWYPCAHADSSDPTILYLINAPTTLMDKGIFEIQRKIADANHQPYWIARRPTNLHGTGLLSSVYVHSDRIAIHVYAYPDAATRSGEVCVDLHKFVQEVLGFQPDTDGRPRFMAEMLGEIFGHYGYAPTEHPRNLGNRLLGIVAVQAAVIPNTGDKAFCHSLGGGPIRSGELPD